MGVKGPGGLPERLRDLRGDLRRRRAASARDSRFRRYGAAMGWGWDEAA